MWNPYQIDVKSVCTAKQKFKYHSLFSNGNSGFKIDIGQILRLLGATATIPKHPDRVIRIMENEESQVKFFEYVLTCALDWIQNKQQRNTRLAPSAFTCTVLFCFQDVVNPYPGQCLEEGEGFTYPKFLEKQEKSKYTD